MTDGLKNLKFEEGQSDFIKFKADVPVKLRVLSVNPLIHENSYTDPKTGEVSVTTKYAFAVHNYGENKAMILDASPTIARTIHKLHSDEDYGEDITKIDIKIEPTGEMLERRYAVNVLPKTQELKDKQVEAVEELDGKLESIIKGGIRAEAYNNGERLEKPKDEVHTPDGEPVDLDNIPF